MKRKGEYFWDGPIKNGNVKVNLTCGIRRAYPVLLIYALLWVSLDTRVCHCWLTKNNLSKKGWPPSQSQKRQASPLSPPPDFPAPSQPLLPAQPNPTGPGMHCETTRLCSHRCSLFSLRSFLPPCGPRNSESGLSSSVTFLRHSFLFLSPAFRGLSLSFCAAVTSQCSTAHCCPCLLHLLTVPACKYPARTSGHSPLHFRVPCRHLRALCTEGTALESLLTDSYFADSDGEPRFSIEATKCRRPALHGPLARLPSSGPPTELCDLAWPKLS